jgi:8-oxo-dGTP pyrophosphatase MutT (NUDIX family)
MRHTSDSVAIDHLAIAILRRDDCVVLVQQHAPGIARPYWVLPGGLVESGELIADTLIREVQEEAGAHVTVIAQLVCMSQIDRPAHRMQTVAFIFEVGQWHGALQSDDPDAETIGVELVPYAEAISRLAANGGWPGIQEPLLAYMRGDARAGTMWFYREDQGCQSLVACVA